MSGAQSRLLGQWGEALVAADLKKKGWKILESGYRCRMGEIDLVVQNRQYLVFVEVKLRKNDAYGSAAAFVDYNKQRKLRAAAEFYLQRNPTDRQPRFDVAEVYAPLGTDTGKPEISYIENAF